MNRSTTKQRQRWNLDYDRERGNSLISQGNEWMQDERHRWAGEILVRLGKSDLPPRKRRSKVPIKVDAESTAVWITVFAVSVAVGVWMVKGIVGLF